MDKISPGTEVGRGHCRHREQWGRRAQTWGLLGFGQRIAGNPVRLKNSQGRRANMSLGMGDKLDHKGLEHQPKGSDLSSVSAGTA